MDPNRDRDVRSERYREILARAMEANGWKIGLRPIGPDRGIDLSARKGRLSYAIQVKSAPDARRRILQALLADACLRARQDASPGKAPLAIVCAPRLSRELLEDLRGYAGRFLGDCAYGFVDSLGVLELHGAGLEDIRASLHAVPRERPIKFEWPIDFCDLGEWVLKVLLADRIPPDMLRAPRILLRNARHLAEVAQVSAASAWRQVEGLEKAGFLERAGGGLRLVRVGELLHEWYRSRHAAGGVVAARWILPPGDGDGGLRSVLLSHAGDPDREGGPREGRISPRICLSGFSACRQLGLGVVRGVTPSMYVEGEVSRVLADLGLRECRAGSMEKADVQLCVPRHPRSVFRAAVVRDGIAVADVVQCWMDVAGHPARGEEQASEIWDRVLGPLED